MHIEPGFVIETKVIAANVVAMGVLAYYSKGLIKQPLNVVKTLIAAIFFSLFMQSFHAPVGPSELHFIGASVMYLTLGFVPTLIGFSVGLLLQAVLFDPQDMVHLGVNSLSLVVPLVLMHMTIGKHYFSTSRTLGFKDIVKIDAIYYAGVTLMVGFWLSIGEVATPLAAWATFASSYLVIIVLEPIIAYSVVKGLKLIEDKNVVKNLFVVKQLQV